MKKYFTKPENITTKNIFQNLHYLDQNHTPPEIRYRDEELQKIADNITPILYGSTPIHTIIYGSPATGKTTAVKQLLKELNKDISNMLTCYLNCRKYYSEYMIYKALYKKVLQKDAPNRGSSTRRLYSAIMKALQEESTSLILVLDDCNYLLENDKSKHDLLGTIENLLKSNENYQVHIGVFTIISTTNKGIHDKALTSMIHDTVYFKPYTRNELECIIGERCNLVFNINIDDDVVQEIVDIVIGCNDSLNSAWLLLKKLGIMMNERDVSVSVGLVHDLL